MGTLKDSIMNIVKGTNGAVNRGVSENLINKAQNIAYLAADRGGETASGDPRFRPRLAKTRPQWARDVPDRLLDNSHHPEDVFYGSFGGPNNAPWGSEFYREGAASTDPRDPWSWDGRSEDQNGNALSERESADSIYNKWAMNRFYPYMTPVVTDYNSLDGLQTPIEDGYFVSNGNPNAIPTWDPAWRQDHPWTTLPAEAINRLVSDTIWEKNREMSPIAGYRGGLLGYYAKKAMGLDRDSGW